MPGSIPSPAAHAVTRGPSGATTVSTHLPSAAITRVTNFAATGSHLADSGSRSAVGMLVVSLPRPASRVMKLASSNARGAGHTLTAEGRVGRLQDHGPHLRRRPDHGHPLASRQLPLHRVLAAASQPPWPGDGHPVLMER